jgi:hypothetical protein
VESRIYKNAPFRVLYDSLQNQRIGLPVTVKILSRQYILKLTGNLVQ